MTFVFQSLLTIGLPLIALPALIHLINLRRHQRVEWAAMEFLLESQKRNKKWILLRQILLLLLRTSAVALAVMMLAGPVLQSQWGRFVGRGTTHHLILLDDSYSMADRWEQTSAWQEAKEVVSLLLDQATARADQQKFTLLRFSQASELSAGAKSEYIEQTLDREKLEEVVSALDQLQVAQTDAGPVEAVQAALRLPEPADDETRIVYVVSDFRRRQWQQNTDLRQSFGRLRDQVSQLHLIQCVDQTHLNLAVTDLVPETGIRAAGVETWMNLTLANYGDQSAYGVIANVTQDGHRLPAVHFEEIAPGEEVTRRFRATFPTAGAHRLRVSLDRDAVEIDNVRYFACQVPAEFPVLLVDGSRAGDDGYYLRTALRPSGVSHPGWLPQVERPSFLRRHQELNRFAAIVLLDVARLDEPEVAALEQYVEQGGGLGIFLGPQINRVFYNERLYRDGTGLLPAPLDLPTQLLRDPDRSTPDVIVDQHPIFRVFEGQRNSFLAVVGINFYYAIDPAWRKPAQGNVRVLAKLRNSAPFVMENRYGEGRVVLQLCKLSPKSTSLGSWSNWSLNPVFPVFAHELIGHLSSSRRQADSRTVGEEVRFELAESDYQPTIKIRSPLRSSLQSSQQGENQERSITPRSEKGKYLVDAGLAEVAGVWQFDLEPREGPSERRLIAVNVPTGEGDLHHLDRSELGRHLEGVDYEFSLASQMTLGDLSLAGFQLGDTLLYLLLGALIAEQWLAYKASYHTPRSNGF